MYAIRGIAPLSARRTIVASSDDNDGLDEVRF